MVFQVTDEMRSKVRAEVTHIMRGARPCVNLKLPAYLGGEGVKKPGGLPRATENMLNPVDPVPHKRRSRWDAYSDDLDDYTSDS